ncbi:M23 family metallopeptidase [Lyngbya confervoides]|uniref:M23 family metallopeptidase n=1 Tax=Lyngbya confervoides BDU141951 TaxID=1574623 RepID=A0ABD4T869_9CYAN|nr:M23 family metallopeptidase [Lyngbya confervoides]MCM1984719.1 M23 family metallopeptidase [Lyngbya confervoides BDU141951]
MMKPFQRFLPAIATLALSTLGTGASQAIEVTVSPKQPTLGETLSVIVTPDPGESLTTAPSVSVNGKEFPAFQIAANRWRALIPTTPLEQYGRRPLTVQGNQKQRNLMLWIGQRWFPTQSIWLPPSKQDDTGTDYEFDRMDALKAMVTPVKHWSGPFIRPNNGPLSTGFGVRRYYNGVFANDYYHRGLDYAGYAGSPVLAAAQGKVVLVGREANGFEIHGNSVGIDHGQGVITIYIHLQDISVQEGQMVSPGQKIGTVGSTGASTGPHLHYGFYVNGQAVDPAQWQAQNFE